MAVGEFQLCPVSLFRPTTAFVHLHRHTTVDIISSFVRKIASRQEVATDGIGTK